MIIKYIIKDNISVGSAIIILKGPGFNDNTKNRLLHWFQQKLLA